MTDTPDQPLISIVTPSYNQARFLEQTIQSVLNQGYAKLEYIIMDGGSNDGSVDIIRRYENRLAYWISEPDKGQVDAINRGFARSSGDILGWLNSDDTYEPSALYVIIDAFQKNPGAQLIYGDGWYVDEHGNRIRPCRFIRDTFNLQYIYNKDPILQQACFWTRRLWNEVGPLDETLYWVFDWDWFIRARQVTDFYYIPSFLANYRVHPHAKTRSKDINRRLEQALITHKYGGWWHPNYLTQQSRIFEYRVAQAVTRWPRWIAQPLNYLPMLFRLLAENIFYGRYIT